MQNAALRTDRGCTQDTNIQLLHDETLTLPIHEYLQLHASQYKQKTQHQSHPLHKHTSTLQGLKLLSSTTVATQQTDPHTITTTDIKTNLRHIHTKYCAHLRHTLAALKIYLPALLIAHLPNSEQINQPFSNHAYIGNSTLKSHEFQLLIWNKHTYTKSTKKTYLSPLCPLCNTHTHTTHIVFSTAATYPPRCHPWICEQTPPEWRNSWSDGWRIWLVDHKREARTPSLARAKGVGWQQQ